MIDDIEKLDFEFFKLIEEFEYKNFVAKNYNNSFKNLEEHTTNVWNSLKDIIERRTFVVSKYSNKINKDINVVAKRLMYSCFFHDYGKTHIDWQESAKNNTLRNVELRHELVYLLEILDYLRKKFKTPNETYIEMLKRFYLYIIPIASHHNKLSHKHKDDSWLKTEKKIYNKNFKKLDSELTSSFDLIDSKLFKLFQKLSQHFNDESDLNRVMNYWYEISMNRYYLQMADKRASAIEQGSYVPDLDIFFKTAIDSSWKLRNLQDMAKNNYNKKLTLLRAPTGSGKTLACILWAEEIIKNKLADRLIIAMPTKFTSNALTDAVKSYGLQGASTQHSNYRMDKFILNDYNVNDYIHSKNLESNVTVCTIDHILNALTLSKEEHHGRLFNFTNSCIVIDESDFYDDYINANITKLLDFTHKFDIPVMIMSATLPDSYVNFIKKNTPYKENIKIEDDKSDSTRHRININSIINYESLYDKINDVLNEKTVIIYANTIDESINIYKHIKSKSKRDDIVLYHSRFKEGDKSKIEEKIISLLGKEAHDNNNAHGIVIMTQIGELSINISSDLMISEIAPIDRLIQRFGRGCRFDKNICKVVLFKSKDIPFPYVTKKDKQFLPNKAYAKTIDIINKKVNLNLNVNEYIDMVNIVYDEFDVSYESKINADRLIHEFKKNIVFNPKYNLDEENEKSDIMWKCRNIVEQMSVYIGEPQNMYETNMNLEFDKKINSISIPHYKMKKINELLNNKFVFISKNGEKHEVFYLSSEFYDDEIGLIYPDKIENII